MPTLVTPIVGEWDAYTEEGFQVSVSSGLWCPQGRMRFPLREKGRQVLERGR